MKKIRLEAAGSFGMVSDGGKDRDALLVYVGEFESMDGPVSVSMDHIALLVKNHNEKLAGLKRAPTMRDYPPIMLDHSNSARDVVGRLVGPLSEGEHEGIPAIFGKVRILGKENIEKVEDGRWTHLSIGADLDAGTMHELTITPFPAAANAALLSQEATMARKKLENPDIEKGKTTGEPADEKKLSEDKDKDDETKKLKDGDEPDEKLSENEPKDEPKKDEKKEGDKLSDDKDEDDKLSDDKDEDDKLSKEEKEDDEKLSKLSSGFHSKAAAVRLAMRKNSIAARLSNLRAEAKITPAEIKKIDLSKLAAATDATIDAVLESYKNRQPVIHTGIFGTIKAETAAQLASRLKNKELTELEKETRSRFTSLGEKGMKKLEGFPTDEATNAVNKKPVEEMTNITDDESAFDEFARMIREGKDEEAREMFKGFARKMAEPTTGGFAGVEMSSLQGAFDELCADFDSFVKLSAKSRKGVKL